MLYEFRSDNRDSMELVKQNFESVVEEFQKGGLEVSVELLGERPCGKLDNDNPVQKRLEEFCRDVIEKHMGRTPGYTSASTDCNIPFSFGIPAATVGLCLGGKAHTREEWIYLSSLEKGFRIAADLILDHCIL